MFLFFLYKNVQNQAHWIYWIYILGCFSPSGKLRSQPDLLLIMVDVSCASQRYLAVVLGLSFGWLDMIFDSNMYFIAVLAWLHMQIAGSAAFAALFV